jgi:hypothetical protein
MNLTRGEGQIVEPYIDLEIQGGIDKVWLMRRVMKLLLQKRKLPENPFMI